MWLCSESSKTPLCQLTGKWWKGWFGTLSVRLNMGFTFRLKRRRIFRHGVLHMILLCTWSSQTTFPFRLPYYSCEFTLGVGLASAGTFCSIYSRSGVYFSDHVRTRSCLDTLLIGWGRRNSTVLEGGIARQSRRDFMDYGGAGTAQSQALNLMRYHSVRDGVQERPVSVHYTATTKNKADALTKVLVRDLFEKFRADVGCRPQD